MAFYSALAALALCSGFFGASLAIFVLQSRPEVLAATIGSGSFMVLCAIVAFLVRPEEWQ